MTGVGTLESRPELAAALAIYTSALARAPAACETIPQFSNFEVAPISSTRRKLLISVLQGASAAIASPIYS